VQRITMLEKVGGIIGKDFWRLTLSEQEVMSVLLNSVIFDEEKHGPPDEIEISFIAESFPLEHYTAPKVVITFITYKNTEQA